MLKTDLMSDHGNSLFITILLVITVLIGSAWGTYTIVTNVAGAPVAQVEMQARK